MPLVARSLCYAIRAVIASDSLLLSLITAFPA
nr:MAG TPA: hypothetical protein [Caudoviricetes sp.]